MNEFFQRRAIVDPAVRQAWLSDRGLTEDRLARHVEAHALTDKVRRSVCDGAESGYFERHQETLQTWSIVDICADNHDDLLTLAEQWVALGERASLCALLGLLCDREAEAWSIASRRVKRSDLGAFGVPHASCVTPGHTIGPRRTPAGIALTIVTAAHPAVFDEPTRRDCRQALFAEWLARERGQAQVEWFWGSRSAARAA